MSEREIERRVHVCAAFSASTSTLTRLFAPHYPPQYEKNAEIDVESQGGVSAMQWDEDGEEGVVATMLEGVKYVGFKEGGGNLELIADYDGGEICTYSNDGMWFAVAIVAKGTIVLFNAREGGLNEIGKVGFEGGRGESSAEECLRATHATYAMRRLTHTTLPSPSSYRLPAGMRCCDLCFGETEFFEDGGIRLLVAVSFSNFFVKVASVEIATPHGKAKVTDFVSNMQRGGGEDIEGDLRLAFVDGNTHLATGGSDGELVLSPVEVEEEGGTVRLKQETFDMLEHKKQGGEWAGEVDWRWSDVSVHPDDSNVWCCCKLGVDGEGEVFIFQRGANSHTISVSNIFENSPLKVRPTSLLARFSTVSPGYLVCAMGQKEGGSVCCVFDVRDEKPIVVSITQLDGIVITKLGVGNGYIMAGAEDGGVFVLSEEKCHPLQNIDVMEQKEGGKATYDFAVSRGNGAVGIVGRGGIYAYGT